MILETLVRLNQGASARLASVILERIRGDEYKPHQSDVKTLVHQALESKRTVIEQIHADWMNRVKNQALLNFALENGWVLYHKPSKRIIQTSLIKSISLEENGQCIVEMKRENIDNTFVNDYSGSVILFDLVKADSFSLGQQA